MLKKLLRLGWFSLAFILVVFYLLPVLAIAFESFSAKSENLAHLWDTVFTEYLKNSIILVSLTILFSLIIALPCSWIVSNYKFKGQKILQWALCLPMAIPAYLVGYLYTDLLDYTGPIQSTLREIFGWHTMRDYYFFDIRSITGAAIILSFVFYPYIFLLSRVSFLEQSENLLHSAKMLGVNGWKLFFKVSLPLARPAIAIGVALVAMETLGDYGAVSYFALSTLTTAIYNTWLDFNDIGSASQIATFMLLIIFLILSFERYSRRKQKIFQRSSSKRQELIPLTGYKLVFANIFCWGVVTLAFFIPFFKLLYWGIQYFSDSWTSKFLEYSINSLSVSISAALICVFLAVMLHFINRLALQRTKKFQSYAKASLSLSSLGYAIPGTVLAIGLLIPFTGLDLFLNRTLAHFNISSVGLIFSGTQIALIAAYVSRFSAMAIGGVDASFSRISPSLDMASQTLGTNGVKMLRKIHFPLLSKGMITALLMVFLECMKELNASLLLRPFNFDTLATHVFTFSSDEQLEMASLPALVLVLVGLIPVIYLNRSMTKNK